MRSNVLSKKLQRDSDLISKNYDKDKNRGISIETNKNGALLKVNSGTSSYFAKLENSRDVISSATRESGYYLIEHSTWPTTHAKDTYLTFNFGSDNTKLFSAGLTYSSLQLKFIPENTYIHEVKWLVDSIAAGIWGLRLSRYKKNKGGMTTKTNYQVLWTHEQDFTPERGVQYSYPVQISLKAGDILTLEGRAPSTTGFNIGRFAFYMQNRINNK
jgi:hypothetical protein